MKTLNNYINEWKANTSTVSSINTKYFIYNLDKKGTIKIFDGDWFQLKDYKDKVYINGEHIILSDDGWTRDEYKPGIYYVNIKDIDDVKDCVYMFSFCKQLVYVPYFNTSKVEDMKFMFNGCDQLISVPLFDTTKVKDMEYMFKSCNMLEDVPLFDTNKVKDMENMFKNCINLNAKTKNEWEKIYDFETNDKKQ